MNRRGFFGAAVGTFAAALGGGDDTGCFSHLGVTALPWPSDATERALVHIEQKFADHNARMSVCIGARDTRTAALVGRMRPGDVVYHREWSV